MARPAAAVAGVRVVPVGSELVVFFPLLRVAQDLVGLIDFLELLLGGFFVLGDVRMVLAGHFAERLLDVGGAGVAGDSEDFVVIFECGGHGDMGGI